MLRATNCWQWSRPPLRVGGHASVQFRGPPREPPVMQRQPLQRFRSAPKGLGQRRPKCREQRPALPLELPPTDAAAHIRVGRDAHLAGSVLKGDIAKALYRTRLPSEATGPRASRWRDRLHGSPIVQLAPHRGSFLRRREMGSGSSCARPRSDSKTAPRRGNRVGRGRSFVRPESQGRPSSPRLRIAGVQQRRRVPRVVPVFRSLLRRRRL